MRLTIFRVVSIVFTASILCHTALASQNPAFTVEITTLSRVASIGQPITIHVLLRSISKKPFAIPECVNTGQAELNYVVDVRNKAGKLVGHTAYGQDVVTNHIIRVSTRLDTLHEGDVLKNDTNLDKFVQMSKPDNYAVQFFRKDPTNHEVLVPSNILTIAVIK